jgi:signal transduction histidine kinase
MLSNNSSKLDLSQTPTWQLLRRWRWGVAVACAVLGYLVEQLEHQLELHLDALEILAYGLILPLIIWGIMTWLAQALADRANVVTTQAQHQQLLDELDKHHEWAELIQFVVRLPGGLLPVKCARLYTYDHRAAQFQLAADSTGPYQPAARLPDPAACKACGLTHHPHYQAGFKEYCQPLAYDGLLIGVLRMQFRTEALLDQAQLYFLNSLAPKIGLALAMSIAQPQQLVQVQVAARVDERRQVAYELHDSLAQHLGYLHLSLDRLSLEGEQLHGETMYHELISLRDVAADAYHQVRDQLALLRSQQSADLIQSLRHYIQLVSRRSRVRVTLVTRGEPDKLPVELYSHVFGLVRESLNNMQRHAHAYEAQVVLYWSDDLLVVAVTDDGVGFEPTAQRTPDHHGLAMLHERVGSLNGQLHIHSAPNLGTRLIFYLPIDQGQAKAVDRSAISSGLSASAVLAQ